MFFLQEKETHHPKNPQGPSNGRVWTYIAGVRVLKIAIFESGFSQKIHKSHIKSHVSITLNADWFSFQDPYFIAHEQIPIWLGSFHH